MEHQDWKLENVPFPDISEEVKNVQIEGYRKEQINLDLIRKGKVDELYYATKEQKYSGPIFHNGMPASTTEHFRSAMTSTIVLASRAAIDGGVEPGEALYIMNVHISLLRQAQDVEEIYQITGGAYRAFAMAVQTKLSQDLPSLTSMNQYYLTQRADKYIRRHICNPITVRDVADALRINYSYLSHWYAQANGITLTQRILEMKCDMAKRLLLTSDMTVGELAQYMGFSSQSHFQNVFRRICGVTPGTYRKTHEA